MTGRSNRLSSSRSPVITDRNLHERINVSYLRIELKKTAASHKTGKRINATRAEIEAAGLKPGDYVVIGTHPGPVQSDLPPVTSPADAETK